MTADAAQIELAETTTAMADLREMSEEEFIQLFEYLRMRTRGFREFPSDLFIENNRYLLPLRLCLGMSQKGLGKALGVNKDWVRHIEAGRNKILHEKIANRYVGKISSLLNQKNITRELALTNWKQYKFARDQEFPEVEVRLKPFSKMSEDDFKNYFDII